MKLSKVSRPGCGAFPVTECQRRCANPAGIYCCHRVPKCCGQSREAPAALIPHAGADTNLDISEPKSSAFYTAPFRLLKWAPEAVHQAAWHGKGASPGTQNKSTFRFTPFVHYVWGRELGLLACARPLGHVCSLVPVFDWCCCRSLCDTDQGSKSPARAPQNIAPDSRHGRLPGCFPLERATPELPAVQTM